MAFRIHHEEPFFPIGDLGVTGESTSTVQYVGRDGAAMAAVVEVEYVGGVVVGSKIVKLIREGKSLRFWRLSLPEGNKIRLLAVTAVATSIAPRQVEIDSDRRARTETTIKICEK